MNIENIELIPSNSKITFLIKIITLNDIEIEDVMIMMGDGLTQIEKNNFKILDIFAFFDCFDSTVFKPIIKIDIQTIKPFVVKELKDLLYFKLLDISTKGPITNLYCPQRFPLVD
jgi:hypothetical protein